MSSISPLSGVESPTETLKRKSPDSGIVVLTMKKLPPAGSISNNTTQAFSVIDDEIMQEVDDVVDDRADDDVSNLPNIFSVFWMILKLNPLVINLIERNPI